ncbi:MAG: FAD-dependent oxidoreductase, partial [Cyanobacteria bacterium P01_D01_bin.2]
GGAFALYPYYRESRRLIGITTVSERDILPVSGGRVAPLPVNGEGVVDAIAFGNYPNDHHYPGFDMPLAPKAIRWGGRWTGTPFTIPYRALVPANVNGLLACDKNISVTHVANGATRLQPVVLGIGQAAGAAAALCVKQGAQPRDLSPQQLQHALLKDTYAPAMVVPCFDLLPSDPRWVQQQQLYLNQPDKYATSGLVYPPGKVPPALWPTTDTKTFRGQYQRLQNDGHQLTGETAIQLVAVSPQDVHQLMHTADGTTVQVTGTHNKGGNWILVNNLAITHRV